MSSPFTAEQWAEIRRETELASIAHIQSVGGVDVARLPAVLLGYQAEAVGLLDSVSQTAVLVIEKSRRIGMTWALAAYAVLRAGRARSAGGMDAMYISYAQEMTREFIDACAMWARAFSLVSADTEDFLFEPGDDDGGKAVQAFRIRFASGFEVIALSSAPRGLRGKQGVVIIDEAAFVDQLAELLKAALVFLMWGGQVIVCSTHDGTENPFNELVQDVLGGRKPYRHMRVDFDAALRQGLYQRICLVRGIEWTPEGEAAWRQSIIEFYGDGADEELFCVPSQGSGAWLTAPLIGARMTLTHEEAPILRLELPPDYLHRPELERRALLRPFMDELTEALAGLDRDLQYALGFDFARVADLSVAKLLAIEKTLRRRSALTVEMRGVPGDEQIAIVGDILEAVRERLVGAAFDATGMGWIVAEAMGRRFGLYDKTHNEAGLVRAIKFTQDWYRTEMPPLKVKFEDAAIALAMDADHLADLRAVKVVRGVPMVPDIRTNEKGDGSKKGRKRHGDFAIALALADFASRQAWAEYGYTPVPDARRQSGGAASSGDLPPDDELDELGRGWWESPLGRGIRGSI